MKRLVVVLAVVSAGVGYLAVNRWAIIRGGWWPWLGVILGVSIIAALIVGQVLADPEPAEPDYTKDGSDHESTWWVDEINQWRAEREGWTEDDYRLHAATGGVPLVVEYHGHRCPASPDNRKPCICTAEEIRAAKAEFGVDS